MGMSPRQSATTRHDCCRWSIRLLVVSVALVNFIINPIDDITVQAFSASSSSIPVKSNEISDFVRIKMENVVKRYFQGVQEKDPDMIRSCFDDIATIRDVCDLSNNGNSRTVSSDVLVQRCIDFVTAHPDVQIDFYYGPECGRSGEWVVAHWFEIGNWSADSCGVPAPLEKGGRPMQVEGQTRFKVNPDTMKIQEFVVTRTFTEWEQQFLLMQQQNQFK